MQNNFQILSTKKLSNSLVNVVEKNNISIDQVSFIETEEIISTEIKKRISELSTQSRTVVFTSSKSVTAVSKMIQGNVFWKIFCIEPATKKLVAKVFGGEQIADSATSATDLAAKIISNDSIKKIIFFCGDQRRDVLPEILKDHKIDIEEIVVYKTVNTPQLLHKLYDGILFFSPSGVKSFFTLNKIKKSATIFTIGNTTAEAVKLFSDAKIVIAENPDSEQLVTQVINYFNSKNL